MEYKKKKNMGLRHWLNMPFIWFLIVPMVILDICNEIYHQIGFRLCGIPLVDRSSFVKIDRHRLSYLNWRNKLGCMYCGYANGVVRYWAEIAGRSERYWCAIRHKKARGFNEPQHHKDFVRFGDEEAYRKKYE